MMVLDRFVSLKLFAFQTKPKTHRTSGGTRTRNPRLSSLNGIGGRCLIHWATEAVVSSGGKASCGDSAWMQKVAKTPWPNG